MRKYIVIIFAGLVLSLLSACSSTPKDPASLFPNKTEAQLFHEGQASMLDGSYNDAVQHFESLDARYPFGKYTRQSQLDLIYTYYEQDDLPSALAAADRYIHLYPRGPNVDYAYYMRGLVQFGENHNFFERYFKVDFAKRDLTALRGAYVDFAQLTRYFPKSQYAADARQRMVYIRNVLARHQLEVADFYLKHKAYVAAANRANDVVDHYQGAPSVPDALAIMVKSYRALHLLKNANDALLVLRVNYPDSKALKSLS